MTTWYVRSDTSHNTTRNGTSYSTAWGGWSEIVWGALGVSAGDTLYICGTHTSGAQLGIGSHGGTEANPVTLRGDYESDLGTITFTTGASFYLYVNRSYTIVQGLTINAFSDSCIALGGAPLTGVIVKECVLNGGVSEAALEMLGFGGWSYVDITIEDNTFTGGGGTGGSAIEWYITSALTNSLTNIQIKDNTFIGCSSDRAVILFKCLNTVLADTKMSDVVVSGNTFTGCGGVAMEIYGPEVYGRHTGIKVFDNIMTDQAIVGTIGGGIVVGGHAPSLTVGFGDNDVYSNRGYELHGPSGFVNVFYGTYNIFDNFADGLDTTTIDGCGILFDHGADSCVAYRNEFRNLRGTGAADYYSGGFGILTLDATNCVAYGNVIVNCVTGVAFGNKNLGQSANIYNNTFINCTQCGAYGVGGADLNNLVKNNVFTTTNPLLPSVRFLAGVWTGESNNCFNGFGATEGHTLAASTITTDPALDERYACSSKVTKEKGVFIDTVNDFYDRPFRSNPSMGAVEEVTHDLYRNMKGN